MSLDLFKHSFVNQFFIRCCYCVCMPLSDYNDLLYNVSLDKICINILLSEQAIYCLNSPVEVLGRNVSSGNGENIDYKDLINFCS